MLSTENSGTSKLYTAKNEFISITVSSLGGELVSIKDCNDTEYLWQANPKFWNGTAPLLFPMVGSLRGKTASIGGDKTCTMERHGIVRKMEFSLLEQSENSISMIVESTPKTLSAYPYDFKFIITYTIVGKTVKNIFAVTNNSNVTMPYFVGGHPAFNCPLFEGEKFEDYIVEFEHPETSSCAFLDSDGLIVSERTREVLNNENSIKMSHSLFSEDALIFDKLKSRSVKLVNTKTGKGVGVDFIGMDYFAIWSALTNPDFVALEPWTGTCTLSTEDDVFEHKRGVKTLEPNTSSEHSFAISILN